MTSHYRTMSSHYFKSSHYAGLLTTSAFQFKQFEFDSIRITNRFGFPQKSVRSTQPRAGKTSVFWKEGRHTK